MGLMEMTVHNKPASRHCEDYSSESTCIGVREAVPQEYVRAFLQGASVGAAVGYGDGTQTYIHITGVFFCKTTLTEHANMVANALLHVTAGRTRLDGGGRMQGIGDGFQRQFKDRAGVRAFLFWIRTASC